MQRRDAEIERLGSMLEGSRDYNNVSRAAAETAQRELISSLNEQISFQNTQILNLEKDLHAAEQRAEILRGKAERVTEENRALQTKMGDKSVIEALVPQLRKNLSDMTVHNDTLSKEAEAMREHVNLRDKEMVELGQRLLAMQRDNERLQAAVEAAEGSLDQLRQQSTSEGPHRDSNGHRDMRTQEGYKEVSSKSGEGYNGWGRGSETLVENMNEEMKLLMQRADKLDKEREYHQRHSSILSAECEELRTHSSRLEADLQSLRERNLSLDETVAALNGEMRKLRIELDEAHDGKNHASNDAQNTSRRASTLETETRTLRRDLRRAEEDAAEARRERKSMETEVQSLKSSLREKNVEIKRLHNQIAECDREKDKILRRATEAEAEVSRNKAIVKDKEVEIDGLRADVFRLEHQLSELREVRVRVEADASRARQTAGEKTGQLQHLEERVMTLETEKEQLLALRRAAEQKVSQLQGEVEGAQQETARVREELKEKVAEHARLRSLFEAAEASRHDMTGGMDDLMRRLEASDTKISQLRSEDAKKRERIAQLEKELVAGREALRGVDAERDGIQDELDTATERISVLRRAQQELEEKLHEANANLKQACLQCEGQARILRERDTEIASLRKHLEETTRDTEELRHAGQLKSNHIRTISDDLANMTKENQILNGEVHELHETTASLRTEVDSLQGRAKYLSELCSVKDQEQADILASYRTAAAEKERLATVVVELEKEVEKLKRDKTTLEDQIDAIQRDSLASHKNSQQLEVDVQAYERQYQEVARALSKARDYASQCSADKAAVEADLEASKQVVFDLQRAREELEARLAAAQENSVAASVQGERMNEECEALAGRLDEERRRVADLQQVTQSLREDMARLEENRENLERQVAHLKTELAAVRRARDSVTSTSERLEKALQAEQLRATSAIQEAATLRAGLAAETDKSATSDIHTRLQSEAVAKAEEERKKLIEYVERYEAELRVQEDDARLMREGIQQRDERISELEYELEKALHRTSGGVPQGTVSRSRSRSPVGGSTQNVPRQSSGPSTTSRSPHRRIISSSSSESSSGT
eukprot:Rmarinus@m.7313